MRGATEEIQERMKRKLISTHAPLAGRDIKSPSKIRNLYNISTHAPLAGRDIESRSCTECLY